MKKLFYILLLCFLSFKSVTSQIDPELEEAFQNILDVDRALYGYNGISASLIYPDGCTWSGISGTSTGVDTITTETMFQVGLCTHFFTATIIMILHEENQLDINDPVIKYLPPMRYVDSTITIRQLLNHSSGLELLLDFPDYEIFLYDDPEKIWHPDSLLFQFSKPSPLSPGERFYWTSTNYLLLGKIIEAITGNSYHEELRTRLLDPLDLKNTFLPPYETFSGKLAVGKDIFTGTLFLSSLNAIFSAWWSANALISTPGDILKLLKALLDGKLLSENSLSMMLDTINIPQGEFGEWKGMGLGIGFLEYNGIPFNGQTSFVLHRTRAYYSPTHKIGVATFITELNGTDAFYNLVDVVNESLDFCTPTSAQNTLQGQTMIYPNPSDNEITIELPDLLTNCDIKIFNHLGQQVHAAINVHSHYQLEKTQIGTGQFFIQIITKRPDYDRIINKVIIY